MFAGRRFVPPPLPLVRRWRRTLPAALAATAIVLAGCGDDTAVHESGRNTIPAYGSRELTQPQRQGGAYAGGTATGDTRRGADFARWVLDQDPDRRYLTDAVVRGDQALGIKVQPTVSRGELTRLMEALAQGMAREFPGRTLAVNAYYQSGDKLAEAVYDPRTAHTDVRFAG